jgi:deazaflavin-dependent oxidoreductase (nitroreductase family)
MSAVPDQPPSPAQTFNQRIIDEFRRNGGRVGGMFQGAPLVLVTTAGRRTGKPRTSPVVSLRDGNRYLIFGSNLGGPEHPGWYHNLLASPQVTMEIGTEDGQVKPLATRAVVLDGAERDRLYQRQCARNPAFREYQDKTSRKIPVVALYPLDLSESPERSRMLRDQLTAHHNTLRAELDRVRAQIEAVLSRDPELKDADLPVADLAEQLRQHCLSYCYGLQLHHIREDGAFSALEQQFPHLTPAINRLRSEHRLVGKALADLEALLSHGAPVGAEDLRAALDRVVSGLEEHFTYEEEHLLRAVDHAPLTRTSWSGAEE